MAIAAFFFAAIGCSKQPQAVSAQPEREALIVAVRDDRPSLEIRP